MHNEEELINRALDNGVMGFVLKENAVSEIMNAISAVAEGEHYFSPAVSGHLVRRRNRAESLAREKPGLDDLTKAELRVLKLIAMKKTSKEIATELFISPRTVEAHRANICTKLICMAAIACCILLYPTKTNFRRGADFPFIYKGL